VNFSPLRYEPYEAAASVPNVVVDGAPNPSTVLSLTHWPGFPAPNGLAADLSAQMVFRYLCSPTLLHGVADVVTNNHFDQDGLVSAFALTNPEQALSRRILLEDVAAAGDFATYRDRRAARLSMLLAAYADPERSPLAPLPADYQETCGLLYSELLERLPELIDGLEDHRELWNEEDSQLSASEAALAAGDVLVEEHPEVDLAVVTIDDRTAGWSGHRFAGAQFDGIHPMALHNATERFALLLVHGRHYRFVYRYETWVQYQSRRPRARVDLVELAEQLTSLEADGTTWRADPAGALTPQLQPTGDAESSIDPATVVSLVERHLAEAPSAWDPYVPGE